MLAAPFLPASAEHLAPGGSSSPAEFIVRHAPTAGCVHKVTPPTARSGIFLCDCTGAINTPAHYGHTGHTLASSSASRSVPIKRATLQDSATLSVLTESRDRLRHDCSMFHVHLGVAPRSASVRLLVKFPRLFRERAPVTGLGLPGAAAHRAGRARPHSRLLCLKAFLS